MAIKNWGKQLNPFSLKKWDWDCTKEDLLHVVSNINKPVERVIQKYKNHPSIQMIAETLDSNKTF